MKKIVVLILSLLFLKADTYVVYKKRGRSQTPCISGDYYYKKIKDAINAAKNNWNGTPHTIKICPGKYNEGEIWLDTTALNNAVIESATNNKDDVTIKGRFVIRGGLYGLSIKDITIDNKFNSPAIDIEKGENYSFSNIDITSNNVGIWVDNTIQNSLFKNLVIESDDKGIRINTNNAGNYFENITINSGYEGIYINTANNEVNLYDMNITTSNEACINIYNSNGNIFLGVKNFSYNILNCKDEGILLNSGSSNLDVNQTYFDIHTDNVIAIEKDTTSGDLSVRNSVFNLNSLAKAIKVNSLNKIYIENNKFNNTKYEAIYANTVYDKLEINNNIFYSGDTSNYDKAIYISDGWPSGNIKNNIFNNYYLALHLFDSEKWSNNINILNNCFINSTYENAYIYDHNTFLDDGTKGNYWSDWNGNGAYVVPPIPLYDNHPLSSCPLTGKPIIEYKMDECSWDNDPNTYEIKNYGSLGSNYNATSLNSANVTDGKICNGGDINSTSTQDKAILLKSGYDLPSTYTLNVWIKFPLNTDGHKDFKACTNRLFIFCLNYNIFNYFNIADRIGSNYDYIYFSYNKTNNTWNLNVNDDNGKDSISFNPQNLSGWHMLTFIVTDNGTNFYLDGNFTNSFSTHPNTGKLGLLFNSDYYSNNDNEPNGQSIGSDVDEFKIFNYKLNDFEISNIYNNEKVGTNYDGSIRTCPICNTTNKLYKFDAWDDYNSSRGINDRHISTKIVNKKFLITLASFDESGINLQEFNGTVCSRILSNTYTGEWIKTLWSGENEKNVTFTVPQAVKNAKINIRWIANSNTNCPLSEYNETNSTDNFAIRPLKFVIKSPQNIYAGEDFNITFNALDNNNNIAKDYNESVSTSFEVNASEIKNGCITGTFTPDITSSWSFSDGNKTITTNYSETGDVNITIKEINGSEFASVDKDDTKDIDRLIQPTNLIIHSYPYEINITDGNLSVSSNNTNRWIYIDSNLSEFNISANAKISVNNKSHQALKNFNPSCYAKDINISFYYFVDNKNGDINLTYEGNITDNIKSINNINKTLVFFANDFNKGTANKSYYFNIDRNISIPLSPIFIKLTDINVSTSNVSKYENNLSLESNATFLYGKIVTNDYIVSKNDFNISVPFVIYDSNNTNYKPSNLAIEYNWYLNKWHNANEGNITKIYKSSDYKAKNDSTVLVNIKGFNNGKLILDINRTDNTKFLVIHLSSDNKTSYLWYSKYGDEYNDSLNSTCKNHYCITITWENTNKKGEVGSGDFNGTESNITDSNTTKTGIKIYR